MSQKTFGRIHFRCVDHKKSKCDKHCENRSVVEIDRNGSVEEYCSIHSKEFWLKEVNYE